MAERRVVYVGGVDEKYTRGDLRKRFAGFGEIENVKIHLRDSAENYGFVTFYSKADAYAAIESKFYFWSHVHMFVCISICHRMLTSTNSSVVVGRNLGENLQ